MVSESREQNKTFRLGIVGKMILNVAVPTAVILLVLAVIVTVTVVNAIWGLKDEDMMNQIQSVSAQITQYFESYFVNEQFVMDRTSVKTLFQEAEASPAGYRFEDSENYRQAVSDLSYAATVGGDAIQSVWIGSIKNSQVLQSNGNVSDPSFEITERDWYKMLEQHPGERILSAAYEDAVTGDVVVSVVTPYNNAAGKMIGVVGIDLSLDALSNYFGSISIGETGYVTVYDSQQNIVHHPDSAMVMTNLSQVGYSSNMKQMLQNLQSSEIMKYQRDGTTFYGATLHMDAFDWSILACMPASEYIRETTIIFSALVIGFVFCIVITSLVCLARTRALVRPLKTIGQVAQEFARGNLESDIHRNTNDEIGDLEEIFAKTQDNLKTIISDISVVLRGISSKNLTVTTSAVYRGDFVQIEDSLRGIVYAMNETMSQVMTAANQVDIGSNHVSNGAQALAQGATEQTSAVEELSATIQEISDKINHTAQRADLAEKQTIAAKNSLDRSSSKMRELVVAMHQIKDSSGQIEGIIKAIDDIAFQTNILALNAAVEAARAGAAGKGFAVVADEVRSLAAKSAEASRNTQQLIRASIEAVDRGNGLVDATAEDLDETATNAGLVMESITAIAQDSVEEAKAVVSVTQGIEQISTVVQTNAATAEQSAASSEELSGQAAMLRDLLKGFKFADRRTEPEASRSFEGDPDEDAGEPAFAGADFNKY